MGLRLITNPRASHGQDYRMQGGHMGGNDDKFISNYVPLEEGWAIDNDGSAQVAGASGEVEVDFAGVQDDVVYVQPQAFANAHEAQWEADSTRGEKILEHGAIDSGPFVVGETITGGDSAATAVVKRIIGTGYLQIDTVAGTFENGELITGGGGANATLTHPTAKATADPLIDQRRIMVLIFRDAAGTVLVNTTAVKWTLKSLGLPAPV